ncbi:MAG: serpin family protein [Clostridia bacterium]|nr:serpin family protein [Clostridia bacterium]
MKTMLRRGLATVLSALMALSCGTSLAIAATPAEPVDTRAVADSVNTLNWKLYDRMVGEKNLFYSAYSIGSAFAMLDAGAEGKTRQEIEDALGIEDIDTYLTQYLAYRTKEMPETCKLTTANSVWINSNLLKDGVKKSYTEKVTKYMGAEIKTVPFGPGTAGQISQWVRKNTNGMISDYQPIVKPSSAMDLLNAIYFYGEWATPFETSNTKKEKFYGVGSTATVDMMHLYGEKVQYYENQSFKAVELPYQNGDMVMDVILPAGDGRDKDVAARWKALSADERQEFLQNLGWSMKSKVRTLALPKFTEDLTADDLPAVLQDIGIRTAFTNDANFEGIAPNLAVDNVNHRAKIEVDEKGSRAAAVTEISMRLTSAAPMPEKVYNFIADHPFVFVIRDTSNGMVLFTGVINDLK